MLDYLSDQKAYDEATDPLSINELYAAAAEARQTAIYGNVNLNVTLGGGLAAAGIGFGALSAVLFSSKVKTEEETVEAALLPVSGGVLLGFHIRY